MGEKVIIVQGGQYGSEAKGAITGYLCNQEKVDIAVRTGATNAGHTVYYKGKPVKMQQLPVGWVNPNTQLVIGAGALIDPEILKRECDLVTDLTGENVLDRLDIDYRAGVHLPQHMERSKSSGRHHAIGATGKGSSEALIDRIRGRGEGYVNFGHFADQGGGLEEFVDNLCDTVLFLNTEWDLGAKILLEGTQGTLLDLCFGPYPYTTHKQCQPSTWLMECGLSPALPLDIVMVVRTFPIRVAGNSGPLPQEISWPILAREINQRLDKFGLAPLVAEESISHFEECVHHIDLHTHDHAPEGNLNQHEWSEGDRELFKVALSEVNARALVLMQDKHREEVCKLFEMTTVTKKLRRVARMDLSDLREASRLVRPHRVALTFMNYLMPEQWGSVRDSSPIGARHVVNEVSEACNAPVGLMSFGPADENVVAL